MENLPLETHTALCERGMPPRTQKTCSWSLLRSQDKGHGYQASLWHNTPGPLHIQESQNGFEEQFIVSLYLLPQCLWICLLDLKHCWASPPATTALLSFFLSFLALMQFDLPRYLPMIFRQILSRHSKAAMDICNPKPSEG